MPAAARRNILLLLPMIVLAGCRDSRSPSASTAVSATATTRPLKSASEATDADPYMYDAYGPRQYSIFHGVNRDNIYRAATGPTSGPADDSVLIPTDDNEW
jgi:hypothetical protein